MKRGLRCSPVVEHLSRTGGPGFRPQHREENKTKQQDVGAHSILKGFRSSAHAWCSPYTCYLQGSFSVFWPFVYKGQMLFLGN